MVALGQERPRGLAAKLAGPVEKAWREQMGIARSAHAAEQAAISPPTKHDREAERLGFKDAAEQAAVLAGNS